MGRPIHGLDPGQKHDPATSPPAIDWSNAAMPGFRPVLVKVIQARPALTEGQGCRYSRIPFSEERI